MKNSKLLLPKKLNKKQKESFMYKSAFLFNKIYFKSEIDLDKLSFSVNSRFRRKFGLFTGYYDTGEGKIELLNSVFENYREFENLLLHEMIHAWQFQKLKFCDHGSTFKEKCKEIFRKSKGLIAISEIKKDSKGYIQKLLNNRLKNNTQYLIKYKKENSHECVFMKNLNESQIKTLKKRGFEVIKNETGHWWDVRHYKSFERVLKKRFTYVYFLNHLKIRIEKK